MQVWNFSILFIKTTSVFRKKILLLVLNKAHHRNFLWIRHSINKIVSRWSWSQPVIIFGLCFALFTHKCFCGPQIDVDENKTLTQPKLQQSRVWGEHIKNLKTNQINRTVWVIVSITACILRIYVHVLWLNAWTI